MTRTPRSANWTPATCSSPHEPQASTKKRADPGESGGEGCQEFDSLGDVAVDGGGSDAEPSRELSVGLTVEQVGEGKQGLSTCVQPQPSGAENTSMLPQTGGQEAQAELGTSTPDG